MPALSHDWQTLNQQYLTTALVGVRGRLQRYLAQAGDDSQQDADGDHEVELAHLATAMAAPPALETVCAAFNLTTFERELLLLCAGVEMSGSVAQLCAQAQGGDRFAYPTFSLALAVWPEAHWSALAPVRPLRRWRLIEVSNGESLTQSRLRVNERVLHFLNGVPYLDDRLWGLLTLQGMPALLAPSHEELVGQIVTFCQGHAHEESLPLVQLFGRDLDSQREIAAMACAQLGLQLHLLRTGDMPTPPVEREALLRLWERESTLLGSALLVDCEEAERSDRLSTIIPFVERVQSLVVVVGREPFRLAQRSVLRLEVAAISPGEQRHLWQQVLGEQAAAQADPIDRLVAQFHLSAPAIHAIGQEVQTPAGEKTLWHTCRTQARTRLDNLAQRIPVMATWEDLVLPERPRQMLREIAAQVRQRSQVYETWGFAVRGANGLGISALFAGASGTGKTMAAEVLAHDLQLDLYRIDLSQVVSKYIGETEKNLRRVFEAAETGGAILLFDEADALFGKRSEVKDSHDRYANIEVSYLLQRMEAYRGLAILTTNLQNAIDPAFLRRIRFVVQFPFPDGEQRAEIWRRMFPPALPVAGLRLEQLAQLNLPGGNIRNIALNAAFLAADAGQPVGMAHLLQAARSEYAKLEKTLTDVEVRGWL